MNVYLAVVAAVLLLVVLALRHRYVALHASVRTAALIEGGPALVEVLWQQQRSGAVSGDQIGALQRARRWQEAVEVTVGTSDASGAQQEFVVAQERRERVRQTAGLVQRAMAGTNPAVDAMLSQVGGVAALLPPAGSVAAGALQGDDVLELLGIDLDVVDVLAGAVDVVDGALSLGGVAFDGHLPVLTLYSSVRRESALVASGKSLEKAVGHGVLDVTASAGGAFVGMHAGAAIGTFLFPVVGTAIGGALGAFAGGLFGKAGAAEIKMSPVRQANDELALAAVAALPVPWTAVLEHLHAVAEEPRSVSLARAQTWWECGRGGLRRWVPTYGDALHAAVGEVALREVEELTVQEQLTVNALAGVWHSGTAEASVAVLLFNCPLEAAVLGVDPDQLRSLLPLQERAAQLRKEVAG